jgi:very-short-patch-repair endonuclease
VSELRIPPGLLTSPTPFAELIANQGRAISTAQLRAFDISPKVITRLRKEGWLHHKHQGVWMVGPPPFTAMGAFWAAHLTTPEQTLLDLADVLNPRQLEIAINQAEIHEILDHGALKSLLLEANGRRGVTPLRHALEAHALGETLTQSELEERFLQLTRDHGFAQPEVNKYALGYKCDFIWREERIVIETDGAKFHRQLRNKELDAQRDRQLRKARWLVDRLSYRQVFFREAEAALILEESGVPRVASPRRRRGARRPRQAA